MIPSLISRYKRSFMSGVARNRLGRQSQLSINLRVLMSAVYVLRYSIAQLASWHNRDKRSGTLILLQQRTEKNKFSLAFTLIACFSASFKPTRRTPSLRTPTIEDCSWTLVELHSTGDFASASLRKIYFLAFDGDSVGSLHR
jgi:hypothetical protein